MGIHRFYIISLLCFLVHPILVKLHNSDEIYIDRLDEISNQSHKIKNIHGLYSTKVINETSKILTSKLSTKISSTLFVANGIESTFVPIYIVTNFSEQANKTTPNQPPEKCSDENFVQFFNGTCMKRPEAQMVAANIVNNRSHDTVDTANALSLYLSLVTNNKEPSSFQNTVSPHTINHVMDNLDVSNLTLNSTASFLMVHRPIQQGQSAILGAAFKRGQGGQIIDSLNEEDVIHSDLSAAAIINQQSLVGVFTLNILIIDKPSDYEYVDVLTNKTLISSVIVSSLRRNSSQFDSFLISLYFKPLDEYKQNGSGQCLCSFYDTINSQWNESGCSDALYNQQYDRYECSCNHLTSFALIWLPESLSTSNNTKNLDAQDIASLVFQSISILCFLLLIMHTICVRCTQSSGNIPALNLLPLISTASTTILFIFFIVLSTVVYIQTSSFDQTVCFSSSLILMFMVYFFLIFMFCIKTSVGYFYYLRFVRLFPPPSYRKLSIMIVISFFISLLCVVFVIGFNTKSSFHITQLYPYRLCWFTRNVIYYFLTIPISIALLINIIIISLVSISIIRYACNATASNQTNDRVKRCVIVLLSSCVTQGIGWLVGPFISFVNPQIGNILGWIFIILNGFEGVWSIILYILVRSQQMDRPRHISAKIELLKSNDAQSNKRRQFLKSEDDSQGQPHKYTTRNVTILK